MTVQATRILTKDLTVSLKVSDVEFQCLQELSSYDNTPFDMMIAAILHRSLRAEMDITLPNTAKTERLIKRLDKQWDPIWKEFMKDIETERTKGKA